jgi:hypothetical protein
VAPAQSSRVLDVPRLPRKPWGILCLVLNIIPGGVGTIVAGVKGKHTPSIIIGIVQLVLVFFILGWIWSVVWGVVIFRRSA